MKKYITLAALLAAGTTLSNAVDSSYIGRTEQGSGSNVWLDNAGNAFSLSLSWDGFVDNQAGFSIDSTKNYYLEGIQFSITSGESAESSGDNPVRQAKIAVYDGDTLVGLSSEALTGAEAKAKFPTDSSKYESMFTFDGLILSATTTYTFKFVEGTSEKDSVVYSSNARYGYQLWSKSEGDSDVEGVGYISGSTTSYLPWIRLGVSAVPEPSAFGLLAGVGALALVASRRRRK